MTEDKKGFSVKDRRLFSEEKPAGEAPDTEAPDTGSRPIRRTRPPTGQKGEPQAPPQKPPRAAEQAAAQLPEVDFSTFIFSLNSATLVHLGIIEDPASGQKAKNLPLAKQTIDILGLLERKTRGNLSSDEEAMLRSILYDLRMIYIREKG
ncbi:MAG: DUF1844 domain-containing protein [Desulfobacterales bacterium]|nr:DUF1844 domain-containing protein [Desulfobacterales bacterium]